MTKHPIHHTPLLLIGLIVAACGGSKPASNAPLPSHTRPITEVSQERLDLDSRLIDATSLELSGRTGEALDAYAEITRVHPTEAAAWYAMASLLDTRGWTDSAVACANRAATLEGDNLWYQQLLVRIHSKRGSYAEAVRVQEHIVAMQPDNLENYYDLSNLNLSSGDLPAAVEALNRVERMIGVTEPISLQKQRIWEAAGKPDKALREIEKLATTLPADKHYNAILAQQYMKQKAYSKAKQCYDRIEAADPNDEYIHVQLAEYYAQLGQTAQADAEMAKAIQHSPIDPTTKLQLLVSFYTINDLSSPRGDRPVHFIDSLVQANPTPEGHIICGRVYLNRDNYTAALPHFEQVIAADSSLYDGWEGALICLLMTDGNADPRLSDYAQRSARLFPMHTLPHFAIAQQALEEKRYTDCLEAMKPVLRWGYTNGYLEFECTQVLSEAYYRTGKLQKAWQAFDRCLELRPNDPYILNNYAYYLSEQNTRLEEALRMSARSLEQEPDNANSLDTYGWILHLLGRDRDALVQLKKATRLDPESGTLQRHLKAIQQALAQ